MKPTKLIIKKLNNKLTKQEKKLFAEWIQKSEVNKELFNKIRSIKENGTDISKLKFSDSKTAWKRVVRKYQEQNIQRVKRKRKQSFLKYAAVFIGFLFLGYGYVKFIAPKEEIVHDSNAITLELDNGEIRVLTLNDIQSITNKDGSVLGTKKGKRLDYTVSEPVQKLIYNTLKVPYGKKFEVTLSDSTLVYLNAGSSLRYPIQFIKGKERKVFLEGEAYFNVSKDTENKFVVATAEMNVSVYGTIFNLSAYPEDKYINTVLVEGSVGISSSKINEGKEKEILKLEPGYKAEWNINTGNTIFDKVDTDIFTGWTEGRLVMKNLSFENIVKKLERHYNVDIKNNYENLNKEVFTASFDIESIDEVLASFSENRAFNFEINNQTITINKP